MIKYGWSLLAVMLLLPSLAGGDRFLDSGCLSGWDFAPLQVDIGLIKPQKLVDEKTHTFLALGLFILEQKSAVLSVAGVANTLQNNYGLQLPGLILGAGTDHNYGISIGLENYCKNCYGIQMGLLNHSWAGEEIAENRKRWQLCGMNIADTVYLGLVNISNQIQIGLFNFSPGGAFQLGLLNYNPGSYIPWMPLVNFNMGRTKSTVQ